MSVWNAVDTIGAGLLMFGVLMSIAGGVSWVYSRGTDQESQDFISRFRRDNWSIYKVVLAVSAPLTLIGGVMFVLGQLFKS